jgi:hypothetical protein
MKDIPPCSGPDGGTAAGAGIVAAGMAGDCAPWPAGACAAVAELSAVRRAAIIPAIPANAKWSSCKPSEKNVFKSQLHLLD